MSFVTHSAPSTLPAPVDRRPNPLVRLVRVSWHKVTRIPARSKSNSLRY